MLLASSLATTSSRQGAGLFRQRAKMWSSLMPLRGTPHELPHKRGKTRKTHTRKIMVMERGTGLVKLTLFKQTRANKAFLSFWRVNRFSLIKWSILLVKVAKWVQDQYSLGRNRMFTYWLTWVILRTKGIKKGLWRMRTKLRPWTNQGLFSHTSLLSMGLVNLMRNHPLDGEWRFLHGWNSNRVGDG